MMYKFHQQAKPKPRKYSLIDFIKRFFDKDKPVEFSISIKFPKGFICDRCECHEYYLVKRKGIKMNTSFSARNVLSSIICLLDGTIFDNASLILILTVRWLFFISDS